MPLSWSQQVITTCCQKSRQRTKQPTHPSSPLHPTTRNLLKTEALTTNSSQHPTCKLTAICGTNAHSTSYHLQARGCAQFRRAPTVKMSYKIAIHSGHIYSGQRTSHADRTAVVPSRYSRHSERSEESLFDFKLRQKLRPRRLSFYRWPFLAME